VDRLLAVLIVRYFHYTAFLETIHSFLLKNLETGVCNEKPSKTILRLNAKAFRNNYNLSDLTKMELSYYAVKVGSCDISKLDMSMEFDFAKRSPSAEEVLGAESETNSSLLTVYDVVLAGVEA